MEKSTPKKSSGKRGRPRKTPAPASAAKKDDNGGSDEEVPTKRKASARVTKKDADNSDEEEEAALPAKRKATARSAKIRSAMAADGDGNSDEEVVMMAQHVYNVFCHLLLVLLTTVGARYPAV